MLLYKTQGSIKWCVAAFLGMAEYYETLQKHSYVWMSNYSVLL